MLIKCIIIHLRIPQIRILLKRIERDFTKRPTHKKMAGVGSGRCAAPLDPERDAAQRVQKRDARGRTNTRKQEEQRDRKKPINI